MWVQKTNSTVILACENHRAKVLEQLFGAPFYLRVRIVVEAGRSTLVMVRVGLIMRGASITAAALPPRAFRTVVVYPIGSVGSAVPVAKIRASCDTLIVKQIMTLKIHYHQKLLLMI